MDVDGSAPPEELGRVSEVLGIEGPFSFPEKLFQRLWARQEFDPRGASTADGRPLRVLHPGRWNHLGGPDFREARIQIGGQTLVGDVELHLRAQDWAAHGHAADPAYFNVILHVVLFPPPTVYTCGAGGRAIPNFALLTRLYHDLEEYAADSAIESLANRPSLRLLEVLGRLPGAEQRALLARWAAERWEQKVRFAGLRVARLGWVEACHHTILEILGYRFNRAPMLRLASRYPLLVWSSGQIAIEEALGTERDAWSLQGVRPANRPGVRLAQYARWAKAAPDWPERLRSLRVDMAQAEGSVCKVRRDRDFSSLRAHWCREVCGEAVGGTRLDTLICDGFLPLLAAGARAEAGGWREVWTRWYPGDLPNHVRTGLRDLGLADSARMPLHHGLAQGLMGWMLAQETRT